MKKLHGASNFEFEKNNASNFEMFKTTLRQILKKNFYMAELSHYIA